MLNCWRKSFENFSSLQ